MTDTKKTNCPECGSTEVLWDWMNDSPAHISQGRLDTSDITPVAYLGCEVCSATIKSLTMAQLVAELNERPDQSAQEKAEELLRVVRAMRDYIDDIPDEAADAFPAMSGFDRDWADSVIAQAEKELKDV